MLTQISPKIAIVGFLKQPANSMMLHQCESLYAYGVISQLARLTSMTYKDLATLPDKVALNQELDQPETLKRLAQICRSTRSHYLFTGSIRPAAAPQSKFEIEYRLFHAEQNKYILSEQTFLPLSPLSSGKDSSLPYDADGLNPLINKSVSQLAQTIFGPNEIWQTEKIALE